MRIHRWLMPLFIALTTVTAAKADEPGPNTGAASPNAAIDVKDGEVHQGSAAEPIQGSYQFLLEVGGITPNQPSQAEAVRRRTTSSRPASAPNSDQPTD